MSYKKTKETLDNLAQELKGELEVANSNAKNRNYKSAGNILASAINKSKNGLALAERELALPQSSAEQDVPQEEAHQSKQTVIALMLQLQAAKRVYDEAYINRKYEAEVADVNERQIQLNAKIEVAHQYERSFAQLMALKSQVTPFVGVEDELNYFLKLVKDARMKNSISTPDLTDAMNHAYDRLTGGSQKNFDEFAGAMYSKHSLPLKLLGGALIALSIALIASAILFAPAIITAASIGLATIYAATAATAVATSALSIGGTSCFFAKTDKMKVAEQLSHLSSPELEAHHYNKVSPVFAV